MKKHCVPALVLAAASATNAQLLYTNGFVDPVAGGRVIYHMDVNTGVSTQWAVMNDTAFSWISGMEVANGYLYMTDGGDLSRINLNTKAYEYIGTTGQSMQGGLGWDGTTMWGTSNGSNVFTVNLGTGAATLVGSLAGTTMSGGSFNMIDGRFYAADDGANDDIISFDPNNLAGGFTKLVDFPLGDSDIDALAFDGKSKFYLVNETNNTGPGTLNGIYVYDTVSGTYDPNGLQTAFTGTAAGGFSAAAWIPAPGGAALLGLAGLVAGRRRR